MAIDEQVSGFISDLTERDGYPPFSDAKLVALGDADSCVLIVDDDVIRAVGAIAEHTHDDGTKHVAAETAVHWSMRYPEFEEAVLGATLDLAGSREPVSVWSMRPSLDRALEEKGFEVARTLAYLVVDLPVKVVDESRSGHLVIRTFTPGDVSDLVDLNTSAFRGHREAATLTSGDVEALCREPWFDPQGLILVEDAAGLAGFCWTRVHPNGDGEIYRIGVASERQGSGVGRVALQEGFNYLAAQPEVTRGTLWVDTANEKAMHLYESTGMVRERVNREFVRR